MLNLVFQMGKSEMERKGNFAPSYLSFPVPFRPFQINPAFLSLFEKMDSFPEREILRSFP